MRQPSSSSVLRRVRPWVVGWLTFQAVVALAGFLMAWRRNEGDATSTSIRRVVTHNGLELRPTNPDLSRLITHRFTLDQIEEAYDLFGNQRDGVVKVAITP